MSPSDGPPIELWHRVLQAHDYALVNPLQVDSSLWSDLPAQPLVPKGLESREELMPQLIALRELSRDRQVGLLDRVEAQRRHSTQPFFSALLVARHPGKKVAAPLAARLIQADPDGDKALLRFYDPRVFQHLCWIFSEDQLCQLLQGIECWTWCDLNGQWQQYEPQHNAPHYRLRITVDQWDDLRRIGLLNRCLKHIARNDKSTEICDHQLAQTANALLKKSREEHHLTEPQDRCLYTDQAIRFDPDLHRHPALAERLRQVGAQTSYVSACADLDDAAMQQVAETLHRPERNMS